LLSIFENVSSSIGILWPKSTFTGLLVVKDKIPE